MKTQNKVQLIGYVGNDPVIKTASNGSKLARIRMATNTFFKNEQGEKITHTSWHDVIAWKKKAEMAENNFLKGSHILIEGHIIYRTYEDKAGHRRRVYDHWLTG